jgi:hypothetical protein
MSDTVNDLHALAGNSFMELFMNAVKGMKMSRILHAYGASNINLQE